MRAEARNRVGEGDVVEQRVLGGDRPAEFIGVGAPVGEARPRAPDRALTAVPLEQARHELDEDRRPGQAGGDDLHESPHLVLDEVHGEAFDDDEHATGRIGRQLVGPGRVEGGGGDRAIPLSLPQQSSAQVDDLGQVEVVPGDAPVVEALETGIETACDSDDGAAGVRGQVSGHQGIECERAHDDPVGHETVAPGRGEVVVEPGDEIDGGPVLEARMGGDGVLGPGAEGQQHGLTGTGQIHGLVRTHGTIMRRHRRPRQMRRSGGAIRPGPARATGPDRFRDASGAQR